MTKDVGHSEEIARGIGNRNPLPDKTLQIWRAALGRLIRRGRPYRDLSLPEKLKKRSVRDDPAVLVTLDHGRATDLGEEFRDVDAFSRDAEVVDDHSHPLQ